MGARRHALGRVNDRAVIFVALLVPIWRIGSSSLPGGADAHPANSAGYMISLRQKVKLNLVKQR
jgi:hypothetical protein